MMNLSDIAAMLPENQKIRIYIVSFLGISQAPDLHDATKMLLVTFHYADLIEAQDINMAKDIACQRAQELWPKNKGWISRTVTVDPVQPDSIKRLLQFWQSGMLAKQIDPPESGIEVDCDRGAMPHRSRPQPSVLIETDKPAS